MALLAPRLDRANTEAPEADGAGEAVGVNRNEQVGTVLVGDLHPLEQRNELVFFARQARLDVVMLMQRKRRTWLAISSTMCFSCEPSWPTRQSMPP